MYANIPVPKPKMKSTRSNLIIVGSTLKYSAIPPQTPPKILSLPDLYNLFGFISIPQRIHDKFSNEYYCITQHEEHKEYSC